MIEITDIITFAHFSDNYMNGFKVFFLFLIVFLHCNAEAQLVNIEAKRMQTDSARFVLKSDLLANYSDNNGDFVLRTRANLTTLVKSKSFKQSLFLVMNYDLVRTKDRDFQNSWFIHLRHNYKLGPLVKAEAFIQDQNNTQLTIIRRKLAGAGIRLTLMDKDNSKAYFGNAYMYEIETLNGVDKQFFNHRNSSYLSINQSFKKTKLTVTGTIYFQPLYRALKNHRILSQFKAELPLTKGISLSFLYNYAFTNFTTNLEDDSSSNFNSGLTISF